MNTAICLAATDIIRDADTGSVSAINILDGLATNGFPFLVQRVAFFALFERANDEQEDWEAQFRVALDGEELMKRGIVIRFQGKPRANSIIRLQGLVIPRAGLLTFELEIVDGATASCAVSIEPITTSPPVVEVVKEG